MHPIKSREDIASAYFDYDVKDFSLDTKEELMKILDSTKNMKTKDKGKMEMQKCK